jgi:hypothetical protein
MWNPGSVQQKFLGRAAASGGWTASKPTFGEPSLLSSSGNWINFTMTRTEMVLETSVLSLFNHLTRQPFRESFIEFSRRESFRLYISRTVSKTPLVVSIHIFLCSCNSHSPHTHCWQLMNNNDVVYADVYIVLNSTDKNLGCYTARGHELFS